ncbi:lysophospholipid acyltransferase family protein [Salinarimonas chemoclinalis]|uniref:lysophospholipid acyltransferase family protein n=1 Tax=Salinarimonas chemoclinalis TaxID=3241599 RepID=UPI0035574C4B
MSLLKRIGRHPRVQAAAGFAFARYLGLVRLTNRFTMDPPDAHARVGPLMPVIAAMWHGQHFLVHLARRPQDPTACLVSRSGDGELNAIALEHLGVRPIRGSGDRGRGRVREKGGAQAMRAMLRALAGGESVVMTADVPKIARRAGEGIVTLARLSGRPIVPVAVVTSRRKVFDSWDRAALGLPFGRGAIVIGDPVYVARDAGPDAIEAARRAVEAGLDGVHARAYALIGAADPGGALRAEPSGGGA